MQMAGSFITSEPREPCVVVDEVPRTTVSIVGYASFASAPTGGNPAVVAIDARGLADEQLQHIATVAGASTTGFVVGRLEPGHFGVRFFTPKQEIDLCGHVTVALFTELALQGAVQAPSDAYQHTAAGLLSVWIGRGKSGFEIEMSQRLPEFQVLDRDPSELRSLLGQAPGPLVPPAIVSTGLRHLVVPFATTETLGRLRPDFPRLADMSHRLHVDTIAAFALTASGVQVRDFCPGIGDNEEAASGTTAGALTSYLYQQGALPPVGEVVGLEIDQGIEMGRPSHLRAELTLRRAQIVRVAVRGTATRLWERQLPVA
jgi:trans-2,3-dihydro-3-hydroxyanthranilate isomerase